MKPANALSPNPAGGTDSSGGWVAGLVPEALAFRFLSVELRTPRRIVVGKSERFLLRVRNRAPIPVAVELPTSRLWGWQVDGVPEADERGFEAPDTPRTVAFDRRETKQFAGSWDGQVRRERRGGDVWEPRTGTHTITAYLAADDWEGRKLSDSEQIEVVYDHT